MRNVRHDYGKKGGVWWAHHGEVELGTDDYGRPLVFVNGFVTTQAEWILGTWGFLYRDQWDWARWRMGEPKLPEPLSSVLGDLPIWQPDRMMAEVRSRDAQWEIHEAEKRARRHQLDDEDEASWTG